MKKFDLKKIFYMKLPIIVFAFNYITQARVD